MAQNKRNMEEKKGEEEKQNKKTREKHKKWIFSFNDPCECPNNPTAPTLIFSLLGFLSSD